MKITLCGSTRFEAEYHKWNKLLSLAGHVVYTLSALPSVEGKKDWCNEDEKTAVDMIALAKIEASEAIVVLNPGGYVGESTKKEIVWAHQREKEIYAISTNNLSPGIGAEKATLLLPLSLQGAAGATQQ